MVLRKIPTFGEVKNWVNANADVPNADHADSADDASTVGGVSPDDLGIPSGVITMWSGATSNVPSGWHLCNGNNGTPDLRNRFIVGAGAGYSVGNTGGESSVRLSVGEMPSHNHSVNDPGHDHRFGMNHDDDTAQSGAPSGGAGTDGSRSTDTSTTGITIDNTGGNQSHENRPPYYALAYIMKS